MGEEQYNIQNNIIKTGVDGTNSKHVSNTLGKLLCSEGETEASQVKGSSGRVGQGGSVCARPGSAEKTACNRQPMAEEGSRLGQAVHSCTEYHDKDSAYRDCG